MASIIETLQDFISSLFSRDPKETEKRKRLRDIQHRLKQVSSSPYFTRNPVQVLPGFAAMLLEFFKLLQSLCELLSKTIRNDDSKLAERYSDYLIQCRLPESQQLLLGKLNYQEIMERLINASSPEEEMKSIQTEFQKIMQKLTGQEFEDFNEKYTELIRLANLCRHDFRKIFHMFDPAFDPVKTDRTPAFSPVPGEKIIQELLDLYFLMAGFKISQDLANNLSFLLEKLEREHAAQDKEKIIKVLRRMAKLQKQNLDPDIILDLMRIIKRDPALEAEKITETEYYLESFKDRLKSQFQRARDRIEREKSETVVAQDLKSLFGGAELLEIEAYNEKMAKILSDKGFETLTLIKPLKIIKSFLLAKFEKEFREPLKKLLIEGHFENKIFHDTLSNTFYGCEGMLDHIRLFEESLKGTDQVSLSAIRKYLSQHDKGKPVYAVLNKLIETIDYRARQLVEEGTNLFYNLGTLILEVLNDMKQKNPVQVSNIKVIGGDKNRNFITRLVAGYNSLSGFTRIMKHFTIIHKVKVPGMERD